MPPFGRLSRLPRFKRTIQSGWWGTDGSYTRVRPSSCRGLSAKFLAFRPFHYLSGQFQLSLRTFRSMPGTVCA